MVRHKDGTWTLTDDDMLEFVIYASESRERYGQLGLHALQRRSDRIGEEIRNKLVEAGYLGK